MATWPSTLPISRENFSESPADRVMRSSMDVGPAKIRRRSTAAVRPVRMKLVLNDAQLDTLDTFYEANEAFAFDFVNPRTSVTERARFTDVPTYSLDQTMWNVAINLELLP